MTASTSRVSRGLFRNPAFRAQSVPGNGNKGDGPRARSVPADTSKAAEEETAGSPENPRTSPGIVASLSEPSGHADQAVEATGAVPSQPASRPPFKVCSFNQPGFYTVKHQKKTFFSQISPATQRGKKSAAKGGPKSSKASTSQSAGKSGKSGESPDNAPGGSGAGAGAGAGAGGSGGGGGGGRRPGKKTPDDAKVTFSISPVLFPNYPTFESPVGPAEEPSS